MRDRIPGAGKAGRVSLTQDDGSVIEGVLAFADEAVQEGSVYSKDNVLPEELCGRMGLDPETAEPKDAFDYLEGSAYKVGDLKVTARTSLGSDWVLANGATLSAADYPELAEVIAPGAWKSLGSFQPISGVSITWRRLKKLNGQYVAIGNSGGSGYIAWADEITGTWSYKKVHTSGNRYLRDVEYGNGYYVIVCSTTTLTSICNSYTILYSTTIDGEYTSKSLTTGFDSYYENRIDLSELVFLGGAFYYATACPSIQCKLYSFDPTSGACTLKASTGGSCGSGHMRIMYAGSGYFQAIMVGVYNSTDSMPATAARFYIHYTGTRWSAFSSSTYYIYDSFYENGSYYYLYNNCALQTTYNGATTGTVYVGRGGITASVSSLQQIATGQAASSTPYGRVELIGFSNGQGFADFNGTTYLTLNSYTKWVSSPVSSIRDIIYEDGIIYAIAGAYIYRLAQNIVLPTITHTGAYTYIKVK